MSSLQNPSPNKNNTPQSSGSGLTMVWAAMLLQGLCQGQPLRLLKPRPCSHQQVPRARKQSELEAASPKTSKGTQAVAKGLPTSLVCVWGVINCSICGLDKERQAVQAEGPEGSLGCPLSPWRMLHLYF